MKRTFLSITRFACAVLFTATVARADYPSTVLSHNPVGYWRFDETASTPASFTLANSGTVGSAGDAHALLTVANGVTGKVGKALKLVNPPVGGSAATGHVENRADVYWNKGLNSPNFTVEFWVQPSAHVFDGSSYDATGSCPISNFNPNNVPAGRVGWLFYLAPSGVWNFRLGLSSGYATTFTAPSAPASAGVWQHIAASYDGSVARLYVNGVQAASANSSAAVTGWVPNTGSFLRFGGTPLNGDEQPTTADANYAPPFNQNANESTCGNRGFDGLLDEVAIYTNVLSASTIAAHYAAATTNTANYDAQILAASPAGYWNFDEAAVTPPTPLAITGVANSGTLGSAANGTNYWGAVTAQPGSGYAGLGVANKAVTMDGEQGYVAINDAPGLHISNNITLMAWVKPGARDYNKDIIAHGWDGVGSETFLRITKGDGYGSGYYYEMGACDGEFGSFYDSAEAPIPDGDLGNWVFVVGTFDGANWNVYRNGNLAATLPASAGDTGAVDVTNFWTIGSRAPFTTIPSGASAPPYFAGYNFAGSIDEPAIFTNALSALDIAALYDAAQVSPVITRAPQVSPIVFKGSTVSLSVWAEGSGTLGYMWMSNGVPTGVTTTNYTISNIPNQTNTTVSVVVTNAYGTNSPSVVFTVIPAPPSILTPPGPETRFAGFPFNFSVAANGSQPLTYFWRLGSTLVQAGSSSSYGGTASLATAGSYTVAVSNETGISVTSAPVALTVNAIPAGYGSNVLNSGPIAYWRLDELSGTIAHDGVGGNDGVYNSATLGVAGYSVVDSDTAASFSGLNSYVGNINGAGAINFPGHSVFSLECWVNAPAGQNDEATIIAKGIGNVGTTRTEQFSVDVAGGAYRFFTSRNGNIVEADATSGPNGTWQHIVAVWDDQNILGGGSNMYIYVNGNLEGQHATGGGANTTTSVVSIGSKHLGNDPNYDGTFNGTVDEVAIYNTALSSATIQSHYAAAYGSNLRPVISLQPTSVTNYAGLPATLSVSAYGTIPLQYSWKKNNVDIGATDSALSFTPLTSGDQGFYSVGITNNVGGTQSVTVFLAVLPPPTNPPNISGLVMHLPMNNSLNDTTGRGNNGTGMHSTSSGTNVVAPGPGTSPDFYYVTDGPLPGAAGLHYHTQAYLETNNIAYGTNDYYVSLGVRPDLKFNSNSFTLAYWVRLDLGFSGGDLPFFTDAVGSEGNSGYVFACAYGYGTAAPNPNPAPQNYGGWGLTIYGGGNGVRLYGDLGSINNNSWHHLVHVVDRAEGTIVTYLDGAVAHYSKSAGTTVSSAGNIDTANPTMIGQDPTGRYGEDMQADIADIGVWRKALSPLEAASIYAAGSFSGLTFTNNATTLPPVTIQSIGSGKVKVTWSLGSLQTATNVAGPYTTQPVTSPYTNTASGTTFYRAKL
jgi:hypothetical protein